MKILVTGATGFVGKATLKRLLSEGNEVLAATRNKELSIDPRAKKIVLGGLDSETDWGVCLEKVDVVVHLAAKNPELNDKFESLEEECFKVNVEGTLNLAEQAERAGVSKFIFMSSIKVNGDNTELGSPFTEDSIVAPPDAYSKSKSIAESKLKEFCQSKAMDFVIIRPPLVYGKDVKGNFLRLIQMVKNHKVLPFGAVHNLRSYIFVDNLVDLLVVCLDHPSARNRIFLVSDGDDISTSQLLKLIAEVLGTRLRLMPIPVSWIKCVAKLGGKNDISKRVFGSLQVDISKTCEQLNWKPSISVREGLSFLINPIIK